MKEFDFKYNSDGTITALRLKNNKYVEILSFGKADIPHLLADVTNDYRPKLGDIWNKLRSNYYG